MNALSNTETDVIIIGAGPAGLCFARALSGKGLHITVIEIGRASCRERVSLNV